MQFIPIIRPFPLQAYYKHLPYVSHSLPHQFPPFFFSHCSPVQALIWSACISSNNPLSFKLFCISRWRFSSGIPSNEVLTTVSSSLAPHPSEWSRILHSIQLGYCFCTFSRVYHVSCIICCGCHSEISWDLRWWCGVKWWHHLSYLGAMYDRQ